MKPSRQRGEFGNWLREQRLNARLRNLPEATAALQKAVGYGIAISTWAELEAGTRRPTTEQRDRLEAFFATRAPSEEKVTDLDAYRAMGVSALIEAVNAQTEVLKELVGLIREDRKQVLRPDGLRATFDLLRAEGLLTIPGIPEDQAEPDPPASETPSAPRRRVVPPPATSPKAS